MNLQEIYSMKMFSEVQYLHILNVIFYFIHNYSSRELHSHQRSVRSPECSYSSLQMKNKMYSSLYLKGSKVSKKLKIRDMHSRSTSDPQDKFVSVELTMHWQ